MSAARVDEPGKIAIAAYMVLEFVAIQHARGWVGVLLVQFPGPFFQFPYLARFQRDMHMIGLILAIDRVFAHQRLCEVQSLDGKVKQAPCIIATDVGDEAFLACGQTENRLAAAAAGGTIADKMRLQQGDRKPSLCQMQRRRTTGNAAAEHGYIDADVAAQRVARTFSGKPRGCGAGNRGCVVGRGGRIGEAHRCCFRFCV